MLTKVHVITTPSSLIVPPARDLDDDGEHKSYHHFHHHEHFHNSGSGSSSGASGRSADPVVTAPGPAYRVASNRDFVEATFVFPNKGPANHSAAPFGSYAALLADVVPVEPVGDDGDDQESGVLAREGFVARRKREQDQEAARPVEGTD